MIQGQMNLFYINLLLSIISIATYASDEYIYIKKQISSNIKHSLHIPNGYTISQYDASNINHVIPTIKQLWQDPEITYNCGNLFVGSNDSVFITIKDNKTLSVLGCIQIGSDKDKTLGVYQLAVEKNHRQKGFAHLLMNMAENYATTIKCSQIILLVRKNNSKALSFYTKCGFSEESDVTSQTQ